MEQKRRERKRRKRRRRERRKRKRRERRKRKRRERRKRRRSERRRGGGESQREKEVEKKVTCSYAWHQHKEQAPQDVAPSPQFSETKQKSDHNLCVVRVHKIESCLVLFPGCVRGGKHVHSSWPGIKLKKLLTLCKAWILSCRALGCGSSLFLFAAGSPSSAHEPFSESFSLGGEIHHLELLKFYHWEQQSHSQTTEHHSQWSGNETAA